MQTWARSGSRADDVFQLLLQTMDFQGERMTDRANAVFQFNIVDGNNWVLDLKSGRGKAFRGETKSDLKLTLTDDVLVAIADGKLDTMQAMMEGKLKMEGNMRLARTLFQVMEGHRRGKVF